MSTSTATAEADLPSQPALFASIGISAVSSSSAAESNSMKSVLRRVVPLVALLGCVAVFAAAVHTAHNVAANGRGMVAPLSESATIQSARGVVLPSSSSFTNVSLSATTATASMWIKGADCSSLRKSEDLGGKYYYATGGAASDALKILRDSGINTIRIRVWVNSPDGYHGKTQLLQIAKRTKAYGLKLLVDLHFSYTWADPGHQAPPKEWAKYSLKELNTAVWNHARDIAAALVAQGTPADYVQIGNEINDGMLWNTGRVTSNGNSFANLAQLLRSGINGFRDASPRTAIILHVAGVGWSKLQWWFDGVRNQGIDWDYTGVSYYIYWHGSLASLQNGLNQAAARYGKPVLVVETGYPWTLDFGDDWPNTIGTASQLARGYPATVAGQSSMVNAVMNAVRAVPSNQGAGVIYFDACWTPVKGNGYDNLNPASGDPIENQALFAFNGTALASLSVFN